MSSDNSTGTARQACARCRSHKRKCDRALPRCTLCTRLRKLCNYEIKDESTSSGSPPTPLLDLGLEDLRCPDGLAPPHIKTAIIKRLLGIDPKDVVSIYFRTICPWFAMISETRLCRQLSRPWGEAKVDFALLCFTITLFSESPQSFQGECSLKPNQRSIYLCSKAWIALLEGAGVNTINMVKSRLLVTLFEVSHGFYPAAYLSVGATVRALDALIVYDEQKASLGHGATDEDENEERMITWCGILILDRYIAVENGKWPPVTRGRTIPGLPLSFGSKVCKATPYSRLFEASTILDTVHVHVHQPTLQQPFNIEEAHTIVNTLSSLETVLNQEVSEASKLYSGGLALCNIAQLLTLNKGRKEISSDEGTQTCRALAVVGIDKIIESTLKMIEPLAAGDGAVDIQMLPPFVIFLFYKVAAILTENLLGADDLKIHMQKLRTLRKALKITSQKWLAGERYIKLLNEDTTPRMLKLIECKDIED